MPTHYNPLACDNKREKNLFPLSQLRNVCQGLYEYLVFGAKWGGWSYGKHSDIAPRSPSLRAGLQRTARAIAHPQQVGVDANEMRDTLLTRGLYHSGGSAPKVESLHVA